MFNRMRIYTVHVKPDEAEANFKPLFIKEGFNFAAFVLTLFWALYKRLWAVSLALIVVSVILMLIVKAHYITRITAIVLHLCIHFVVGFQANDWVRDRLRKQGYILSDITAADSYIRAQQRYLERYVSAA